MYLMQIYETVFKKPFDKDSIIQKLELGQAIYLLCELGVPVGKYGFRLTQNGVRSLDLDGEINYESKHPDEYVEFAEEYIAMMDIVGELMGTDKRGDCPLHTWLDYLCTIHYVMENVVRRGATDDEIWKEIERRRGHPVDEKAAIKALTILRTII